MRTTRHIILALLLVLGMARAGAATVRLFTSDRLSSAFVSSVAQSHEGFIWAGTGNGLDRFDGYHFTHYLPHDGDTTSLPHRIVTTLFTDRDGRMWVGTGKGLARYDSADDRFVRIKLRGKGDEEPRVTQMAQLADGRLVIGTSGYGLFLLGKDKTQGTRTKRFANHRNDDFCFFLHVDRQGRLWQGDNLGRITCNTADGRMLMDFQSGYGMAVGAIDSRNGDVTVAFNNGIATFSKALKKKRQLPTAFTIASALAGNGSALLFGTNHGVKRLRADGKGFETFDIDNNEIDFTTTNVNAIFADHQRNLWVSCTGRGLLMMSRYKRGFTSWTFADEGIKTGSTITTVAKASDGGVWVALRGARLYHFTPTGRIDRQLDAPEGLTVVFRDGYGAIWLCAGPSLYRFDESSGRTVKVATFDCDYIQAMEQTPPPIPPLLGKGQSDRQQRLFIATFGRGIMMLSPALKGKGKGWSRHFSMHDPASPRGHLCNDWVFDMLADGHGLLWIATASGVSCYNPAKDTFRTFGWDSLLDGYGCMSLAEDRSGNIVIGTVQGLFVYDRRRNRVSAFPGAGVLRDKTVSSIVAEANGDLYLSTNAGLYHYRHSDGQFIGHVSDNGLREHEFTENSGTRLADGRLLFSSNSSLVVFAPASVSGHRHQPLAPVLTSVFAGGKTVSTRRLHFSYQDNTFTLTFSNFDFSEAANIVLEYRLGDDRWSSVARGENDVTFSHLQPGTYRLHVRAEEGGLYSAVSTYTFTVGAPWYRTTVAYIVYLCLLLAVIAYVVYRYNDRWQQRLAMERLQRTIDDLLSKPDTTDSLPTTSSQGATATAPAPQPGYGSTVTQRDVADIDKAFMDKVMASVSKNMDDSDYSVEQMAQDAGLSRSQLQRKMKELTGVSPSDFLRTLRLEQGARLLRSRRSTVTQVAYAVGFASQNTFTKAFKQHFGLSPTDYAARFRSQDGGLS